MGTGVGLRQVGYFDCAGGGQVVVVDGIAYIGHMRSPHGTSIVDVRDPKNCKELASIGMPPGTHSHKVRVANGMMVVNHEINGADPQPGAGRLQGRHRHLRRRRPRQAARDHALDHRGQGRAPLRFRRPLRLPVADAGGLRRHHRDDHGPQGPGAPAGGRPLVDAGAMDRRRRDAELGQGRRIAAIIRCGSATGSTPATGRAVSSSSTSTTWRSRSWCPASTGRRRSPARPTRRCRCRSRSAAAATWSSPTRTCSAAMPRSPAFMWMVDITDERRPVPVGSFQVEGIEGSAAADHDRLPSAVREGDRHRDPVRLVRARAAHHRRRRTRTARARSRTSCPTCRRAPTACRATTSPSTIAG